jgi:hypothetical protein
MKTLKIVFVLVVSLNCIILLAGCGGVVKPATVYHAFERGQIKSAYVVKHDSSVRGVEMYIQKVLSKNGIKTSGGSIVKKPTSTDIYVTFLDLWKWDFNLYLWSLDIYFYENSSGTLLASGKFDTYRKIHKFPDPEKVTEDVVQSILTEMNLDNSNAHPQPAMLDTEKEP